MRVKAALQSRVARLLSVVVLVAAAGTVGALLTAPESARARKGYGGYGNYKPCGPACKVDKCRKQCRKAKRTCVFCARADKRAAATTCTQAAVQTAAACSGDRVCRRNAKTALRTCRTEAKGRYQQEKADCTGRTGTCGSCCADNYGGACRGAFVGTDGYGSYFRKVTNYGKVKTYRPNCELGVSPGPGPAPGDPRCTTICESVLQRATAACGGDRRAPADPACLQAAQDAYQACLANCGGATPTTTTTSTSMPGGFPSTTTTTTPGLELGCCLYYPNCNSGAGTCAPSVLRSTCDLFTQAPNCGSFLATAPADCTGQLGQGCGPPTTTTTTIPVPGCCLYYANCDPYALACAPNVSPDQCAGFSTSPNCGYAFGPPSDCAGQAGAGCPNPPPTGCCHYSTTCDPQNPACLPNATAGECASLSQNYACGFLRTDIPADCTGAAGQGCPPAAP